MKPRNVIALKHQSQIPGRTVEGGILMWLFLDRLDAAGWVYGIVFTILGILFVTRVYLFVTDKQRTPVWAPEERKL